MVMKPDGKMCQIVEQVFKDIVTGLIIEFHYYDREDGSLGCRMSLFADDPSCQLGIVRHRDFVFDMEGKMSGTGSGVGCVPRPKTHYLKPIEGGKEG